MERIDRRRVLRLSGAGAVAGATGGLAGVLASGRAPAFAQGTTLHWVRGSDYVPVSDQMIRTKLNELAQKELGLKINLEGVDGLTIQPRVASAISSGSGPDIICALNNWAQLYADSVADVSDVAEEIGNAQGAIRKPRRQSPMTARNGLPSRTPSSDCRSSTVRPGGTRSAMGRKNIRQPGTSGAKPARS
jgi:multiple sugar transport system substrate-binding protein